MIEKKEYETPQLIVHGDVERITLNSNQTNADSPAGIANTANPVLT